MYLKDFLYELPERLIAQRPAESRTGSRLMVVDRSAGTVTHDRFEHFKGYLAPGDCLVLNDTRVMPARLYGRKEPAALDGGEAVRAADTAGAGEAVAGARVELLLIRELPEDERGRAVWEAVARPGKRLREGVAVTFGDGALRGEIIKALPSGHRVVRFDCGRAEFAARMERFGRIPLPPYIKSTDVDPARYQTVYANLPGSAAAPTAGLHFTRGYLDEIAAGGVDIAYVTLHVGPGTFAPVKTEVIEEHRMHSEFYSVGELAAQKVNAVRGRVVAVGTTGVRTLESAADAHGTIRPGEGETEIFIYPGYKFRRVDALLTNFHLPGSTLLMLVCAFAGYDLMMEAYRRAVAAEYRFFSFGDAMLIL